MDDAGFLIPIPACFARQEIRNRQPRDALSSDEGSPGDKADPDDLHDQIPIRRFERSFRLTEQDPDLAR